MGPRFANAIGAFNQLPEVLRLVTLASLGLTGMVPERDLLRATTEFTWRFIQAVEIASQQPASESESSSLQEEEEDEDERDSFEASDNSEILLYEKHDAHFDFDRADEAHKATSKRVNRQFSSKQEDEAEVIDLDVDQDPGSSRDHDEMVLYLRALQRDGWEASLQTHPRMRDVLGLIMDAWGRETNTDQARETFMALLTSDNIVISARSGRTRDVCVFCGETRSCDYNVPKLGGPAGVHCVRLAKALQAWSDAMAEASNQVAARCRDANWRRDTYTALYQLEMQILQRHQEKSQGGQKKRKKEEEQILQRRKKSKKEEEDEEDE